MAIRSSAQEIEIFKANLDLLMPYHDHQLLNTIAKGLYTSSDFTYGEIKGLSKAIVINRIQMYSRHNVQEECKLLCSHLPLAKVYQIPVCQNTIDEVEYSLFPNRKAIREKARAQYLQESIVNDEILSNTIKPSQVDTSDFPELSQGLVITNASDEAFAPQREDPPKVTIYGVAAAHVVEYLTNLYPNLEINVVVLNPEITAIMLSLDPLMGKRLAHKNVHLIEGQDDTPIFNNRVVLLPELMLVPQFNARLKQRLLFNMERNYNSLISNKKQRNLNQLIAQYNYPNTIKAPQLTSDVIKTSEEIALVFPGASLEDSFDRLCELKNQGVCVIASDTALPFLEKKGLSPNIVVSNDIGIYKMAGDNNILPGQFFMKKHFYDQSTLIYNSKTHLLIPALFSGNKYIIYTNDMRRLEIPKMDNTITDLDITLSNSSLMISLAIKMQPQRVYLFGLDTVARKDSFYAGFDDQVVSYLVAPTDLSDVVDCNDGRVRKASHKFTAYRLHVEEMVESNVHIEFINCSPFGAIIKGCTLDLGSKFNVDYSNYQTLI